MRIAVNAEGALALREFAKAMPLAVDNIVAATEKLIQVYQSVSETLGEHDTDFYNLLVHIKNAQELAAEAIKELPPKLNVTADKIDIYVATHATVSGQ